MGLFGFGKSYSKEDLQREISKLENLYGRSISGGNPQLKQDLINQFNYIMEICRKGHFEAWETVMWLGNYTSLRNVTQPVQVLIEIM